MKEHSATTPVLGTMRALLGPTHLPQQRPRLMVQSQHSPVHVSPAPAVPFSGAHAAHTATHVPKTMLQGSALACSQWLPLASFPVRA